MNEPKTPKFDEWWNFGDAAGTEKKFREHLPEALDKGDQNYILELQTQIARTLGLQKKFDEAHQLLDKVKADLKPDTKRAKLRYLLERGRVFNSSGKKAEARPLFLKAWEFGQEIKEDRLAVDAAHMMGIIEPADKQIEWNEKAIAYAEASNQEGAKRWLGSLYNNLGWTYFDLKKYDQSLALLEKALVFNLEKGDAGRIQIAKWSVARLLRAKNQFDAALAIQEELLAEHEKAGTKDGFVHEELGELYLQAKQDSKSKKHFALAYPLLEKMGWVEKERLERAKEMGGL